MNAHTPRTAVGAALLAAALVAVATETAWAKTRAVLVLPFQGASPGDADPWLGEAIAETLVLAAQGTPLLLPIDRGRAAQAARLLPAPPAGGAGVVPLARAVRADLVFLGEYQRTPEGGVVLAPKVLEVGRGEAQALETVKGGPERVLDAQAELISVYVRALKLGLKPDDVHRLVGAARPTTSLTALEAFAKGRRSVLRGTQEGNEGAVELLARAVEVDPSFGLAHYHLGVVHLALGNRWKAAAQFRAAAQVDPGLAEPFKSLGDLFMSSPRRLYDQAIEHYQRALALRPHFAEAQVGLGEARAAKGDHEGAIAHYQKALALDPLNARVHFAIGKIYYNEKGLYYEAVNAYKKAIDLDQGFVDARLGLGEIYEEKGLYKDAIAEYRKIIEVDARHTGAHYNLALAYEKVDPREAITHWERYIALASQVASEKEWVDVARQHLRKLRDKHPQ